MAKAYVDTTVLTDALLKFGDIGNAAKEALRRYTVTELPVYAIKEFKAGPLSNHVWMHNKLALTNSFRDSLAALQRMSLSPKRYTTSTAIEALTMAADSIGKMTAVDLELKYGKKARLDSMQCDEYRLILKYAISKAWRLRRRVTTQVVQELSCYQEVAPFEERGILIVKPTSCQVESECCLGAALRADRASLRLLERVLKRTNRTAPAKRENNRRYQVLHDLVRKPKLLVSDKMCRNLGDAVFAFFAPADSVILTTNYRDHNELANSLGKAVESP